MFEADPRARVLPIAETYGEWISGKTFLFLSTGVPHST